MNNLYKLTFRYKKTGDQLQGVLVTGRDYIDASKAAREYIARWASSTIVLDEWELICSTPDTLCQWA